MEKKKNVKVIVLIVAIAVVLIGTSAGVMFAFGVFSSDKAKAFDLLKQAPEKMMYTSSGEYIGSTEMTKGMLEHGMNLDVKYSNLKMSGLPETSNGIMSMIDKMEIGLGLQFDMENQKGRFNFGAGTNGSNINLQAYASLPDKKLAVAVPELLKDKVFTLTADKDSGQEQIQKVQDALKQVSELKDSFSEHLQEQGEEVYDGTVCEKVDNGYRLTIPKNVTNDVINSLRNYVEEQKAGVEAIESALGAEKGSIASALKQVVPELTKSTADFTFDVYGERGKLTGLKADIKGDSGTEIAFDVTFAENKNQSSMSAAMVVKENGKNLGKLEMKRNSTEDERCEDSISYKVTDTDGEALMDCQSTITLDKSTKAVTIKGSSKSTDTEAEVSAKGSIKNLDKGKCVTYQLDEMKTKTNSPAGSQELTCSVELTQGVLDGEITAPKGKEIPINQQLIQTFSQKYSQELMLSAMDMLSNWGINLNELMNSGAGNGDSALGNFGAQEPPDIGTGEDYDTGAGEDADSDTGDGIGGGEDYGEASDDVLDSVS